jgi:hypothetical protein
MLQVKALLLTPQRETNTKKYQVPGMLNRIFSFSGFPLSSNVP